jgi:hypothetical protein
MKREVDSWLCRDHATCWDEHRRRVVTDYQERAAAWHRDMIECRERGETFSAKLAQVGHEACADSARICYERWVDGFGRE